jgi:hypothetical protein
MNQILPRKPLPPLLIMYVREYGWQLCEIDSPEGTRYTPQAFEAEYGYLPKPLPSNPSKFLRKKLPEYYMHRKNPQRVGSDRGFGKC